MPQLRRPSVSIPSPRFALPLPLVATILGPSSRRRYRFCIFAYCRGLSETEIAAALSRDYLSRDASRTRQNSYIRRTIAKRYVGLPSKLSSDLRPSPARFACGRERPLGFSLHLHSVDYRPPLAGCAPEVKFLPPDSPRITALQAVTNAFPVLVPSTPLERVI